MSSNSTSHPKGLYFLFSTEMWERFNFYGMRALLSLFLINALDFSQYNSSILYGGFLGLSLLTPMLGGYISDRFIGNRNSIIVGGFSMALGQLLLFSSASSFKLDIDLATNLMYGGLLFIIVGNGFFKPNISSMVGQSYEKGDSRLDAAFSIFYMGINTGATLGMLICPWLGDVVVNGVRMTESFKWGFLASGIAMIIGTTTFVLYRSIFLKSVDGQEIGLAPTFKGVIKDDSETEKAEFSTKFILVTILLFVTFTFGFHQLFKEEIPNLINDWVYPIIFSSFFSLGFLVITERNLSKIERDRIMAIFIIAFFVIFFWAAYEQAGTSLTFIADKQTDLNFLGFQLPPSSVQNASSIFIIVLVLPFTWLWMRLAKKGIEPNSPGKQAIGLLLLAIGYLIIAMKVKDLGADKLGVIWLFIMYLFHTMGELSLSPIGLSLVSQLAPKRFSSLLMGVWLLAIGAGSALAGKLGTLLPPATAVVGQTVFPSFLGFEIKNLYDFFIVFVIMAGIASVILFGLANGPLKRMMHGIR